MVRNCLSCVHWRRVTDLSGVCLEHRYTTSEGFVCGKYEEKIRSTDGRCVSVKVTPSQLWDQGGDVYPVRVQR